MNQVSLNTKIDSQEKKDFDNLVKSMGLTTSAVLRNFVKSFNKAKGFPYDINYPISAEEHKSLEDLHQEIEKGTAKSYSSVAEMLED